MKIRIFQRSLVSLLFILALTVPSLLIAVIRPSVAGAAQLSPRKIAISTSKAAATSVTYSVNVTVATTDTIKGIVVQICNHNTGPLIGSACTGPNGFDFNLATLNVVNQKINNVSVANVYAVNGASTANTLILTNATGNSANSGQTLTFDIGSGAGHGVTNPDATDAGCTPNNCTFYGRILTYNDDTIAAAYTDTAPGSHVDEGGVALSTANQLTTSARVQENLQFCVGTTSVGTGGVGDNNLISNDCSNSFTGSCGTAIDLGILDTSAISVSPVQIPTTTLPGGGNNCNGAAMVRTNASSGVVVSYFSEQDSGSGQLKVTGASCTASSNVDQCFNDNSTQGTFTAGTEAFGLSVDGINNAGTTSYVCSYTANPNTCKLEPATNYLGAGTTGVSEAYGVTNGFAWDDTGTANTLATSTGPVDDEAIILRFAATPTITTPTGSYSVTSTYIATATF